MTWWRVGSMPATAARSATVLPAPTSPVTTPSADSTTPKLIRAIAAACAGRANRSRAAMDLPNGVRARPKCAAHGAALTAAPRPGRGRRRGAWPAGRSRSWLRCRRLPRARRRPAPGNRSRSGPAPARRPGGRPGGPAVEEYVDRCQVLGVVAQLDAASGQRGVDGVGVALQRDGRGAGHLAGHRPAERLREPGGLGLAGRPAGLEPADRRAAGLGVPPPVGHLLGPRGEQVVQLLQRLDALMGGLGQERLPDIAVQPLLLP